MSVPAACVCGWVGDYDGPIYDGPEVQDFMNEHMASDLHRNGLELRNYLRATGLERAFAVLDEKVKGDDV